jgi:protocatechuate 3,4-dioxygenase beta subunit
MFDGHRWGMTDLSRLMDGSPMSRRRALGVLGGFGLAAIAAGCADDGGSSAPARETSTTTAAGSTGDDVCVLTPELTEGPYYLDLDLVRRDIREGRPGSPFDLRVEVVEADACTPIENAAVDIWHCDAGGAYSGVSGDDGTFLRGIQMTDADGVAEFRTIYPGWYTGRAVHIHVKVNLGGSETFTGQLFFDDTTTAGVYEAEPYADRGEPDTSNAADGIFGQSGGSTVVAVTREGAGNSGAVTLGVQRV